MPLSASSSLMIRRDRPNPPNPPTHLMRQRQLDDYWELYHQLLHARGRRCEIVQYLRRKVRLIAEGGNIGRVIGPDSDFWHGLSDTESEQ